EADPDEPRDASCARGRALTDRPEDGAGGDDGRNREQRRYPRRAPARARPEREGEHDRGEQQCSARDARFDLVGCGVPRDVLAGHVDPAPAVESEESVQHHADADDHETGAPEAGRPPRSERAPEAEAEADDEKPGEVRTDLVVEPRARCRLRAEVADVV